MRHGRAVAVLCGSCVLALAGWACESARNPGGFQQDLVPPVISLTTGSGNGELAAAPDTQVIANGLAFTVNATDNLALNDIRLTFSGGFIDTTDTIFANQTLSKVTLPISFSSSRLGSGAGGRIQIIGRATDGAGNYAEDTLFIFLTNPQALIVTLVSPGALALASAGKYVPIEVIATQLSGIQRVGWVIGGVAGQTAVRGDSVSSGAPPLPTSVDFVDSVLVTGTTGTFTVTGFAVDSGTRRGASATVLVTIQSVATDVTPPRIEQTVALRAESTDSITVHATDPSGITRIGFVIKDTLGAVIGGDSLNFAGNSTDISRRFSLKLLGITKFPTRVVVQAFAIDGATTPNRGVTGASFTVPSPTGPARADTVTIVAGITRALPFGGTIGDAIFNAHANGGTGELYLTNTALSRVEVFQVANSSFVASGIPTAGPQPWGIALWPRDTLGNYGDSIVVADAGGTEMSILDVVTRRLKWRQDLPNYSIEKYKVLNVGGIFTAQITLYDLSDRPQYIATVCRVGPAPLCNADSIYVLYSTTPTVSSTSPFNGKGTLRMEKLINTNLLTFPADTTRLFGHFFWEIGGVNASNTTDTLRVVLRRGLPYNQTSVILSACAGVTIDFQTFGLGDSTYARNSGNFTHGFFGEGGNASNTYRRAMGYTTKQRLRQGPAQTCATSPAAPGGPQDAGNFDLDFGMSPAVDVSDLISNTGVKIASIATNFNGGTNMVRADSIYIFDEGLRLKGLAAMPSGVFGMDMNYNHDFLAGQGGTPGTSGGVRDSTNRVVFAADASGNIRVFDTFFYSQIGSIPVRDPIIGPLRVAKDALGNQLLFGVTQRGLVMVRLPVFPNPNPAPPRFNRVRHSP
jgi:hypothetical protein